MNYRTRTLARTVQSRGMSLVELMVALTISVLILGVSVNFLVEATRATLRVQSNTQNDLTEWGIYAGITIDTRIANGMTLYKNFVSTSFDAASDEIVSNATRGDFLVLSQSTQAADSRVPSYSSLTGYLFTAGPVGSVGKGTFKKFTYAVPVGEKNNTIERILSDHYSQFVFTTVAVGLDATHSDNDATTPTNRAFLYRSAKLRSGVLNLEVTTGYTNAKTANKKLIETAFFIRS